MSALAGACEKAGGLRSLRSFTFTLLPEQATDAWMNGTVSVLEKSPLEFFQVYAPDSVLQGALADQFCVRIVDRHRDHLVRFSFHRLRLSLGTIDHVCLSCTKLEQLFMVVNHEEMVYFSLFPESALTYGFVGIPCTNTRPSKAFANTAYQFCGATDAVQSLHARAKHYSPVQSDALSDWSRNRGLECRSVPFTNGFVNKHWSRWRGVYPGWRVSCRWTVVSLKSKVPISQNNFLLSVRRE